MVKFWFGSPSCSWGMTLKIWFGISGINVVQASNLFKSVHDMKRLKARRAWVAHSIWVVLFLFGLHLQGCSTSEPVATLPSYPLTPVVDTEVEPFTSFIIGQGDKIGISIYGQDSINSSYTVMQSGYLMLPMLDDIRVEGKSIDELRDELTEKYAKYFKDPQVLIEVQSIGSKTYTVLGEVKTVGMVPLNKRMSVSEAVFTAGSVETNGTADRVVLIRRNKDEVDLHEINIAAMYTYGDFSTDMLVQHGDIIYVPTSKLAKVANFMSLVRDIVEPIYTIEKGVMIVPSLKDALDGNSSIIVQ